MKKLLVLLFAALSLSQVKASDTLTVRQVFNFSVGDTFDYYTHILMTNDGGNGNGSIVCYRREIITAKRYSSNDDTATYTILITSIGSNCNSGTYLDTISITNLDSSIFSYNNFIYGLTADSTDTFSSGLFFDGRTFNNIGHNIITNFTYYEEAQRKFIDGLGLTLQLKATTNPNPDLPNDPLTFIDVDSLTYFSNGTETFGKPYYILAGINDVTNLFTIKVSPNPTTDQIHLSISNAGQYNEQLILTDLLGQEVYSSQIIQNETTHDISKLVPGIYTWRIVYDDTIIKTGKVVKQ